MKGFKKWLKYPNKCYLKAEMYIASQNIFIMIWKVKNKEFKRN